MRSWKVIATRFIRITSARHARSSKRPPKVSKRLSAAAIRERMTSRTWPRCRADGRQRWRSEDHEVIPVDEFRLVHITENGLNLGRRPAENAARLSRAVVYKPACDLPTVGRDARNDGSAFEIAVDCFHTDRQQTFPAGG